MIPPSLSRIKVVGTALIPNCDPIFPFESRRAVKVNLCLSKNFFTLVAGSRKLTATMAKSLSLNRLCNFSIKGISIRHSGHHVVQKFRNTILPLKSARVTRLSCMSKRLISTGGAIRGILMIFISRNNRSVSKSESSVALAKTASGVKLTPMEAIRARLTSSNAVIVMYFFLSRISFECYSFPKNYPEFFLPLGR